MMDALLYHEIKELLEECRKLIDSVPDKSVFGIGGDGMTHWFLADRLLAEIAEVQEKLGG